MRIWFTAATAFLLLACGRGEPVPRDYQNAPPAMTHPVTSSSQTPTAHGLPGAAPEPSSGAEGTVAPNQPVSATAPTLTLKDQAPSTPNPGTDLGPPPANSPHTTQTTSTAVTSTHLASPPL